jgi:hypothetical protein
MYPEFITVPLLWVNCTPLPVGKVCPIAPVLFIMPEDVFSTIPPTGRYTPSVVPDITPLFTILKTTAAVVFW